MLSLLAAVQVQMFIALQHGESIDLRVDEKVCELLKSAVDDAECPVKIIVPEIGKADDAVMVICHHDGDRE